MWRIYEQRNPEGLVHRSLRGYDHRGIDRLGKRGQQRWNFRLLQSRMGITTDGTNLYVADELNNEIRKVSLTPPYAVTTIAGSTRQDMRTTLPGPLLRSMTPMGSRSPGRTSI